MSDQLPNNDVERRLILLRAPFKEHEVSLLPKPYTKDSKKENCKECGGYHGMPALHLAYVGHAAITKRLLEVDPKWNWASMGKDANGLPLFDSLGGLWGYLTVCGVTRIGYGDSGSKSGPDAIKERIGDFLRNAAMRFGCGLEFWHKGKFYTKEEVAALEEEIRAVLLEQGDDAGDDELPSAAPKALEEPKPLPEYTEQQFNDNFAGWEAAIKAGRATAASLTTKISSKYTLTEEQKAKLNGITTTGA